MLDTRERWILALKSGLVYINGINQSDLKREWEEQALNLVSSRRRYELSFDRANSQVLVNLVPDWVQCSRNFSQIWEERLVLYCLRFSFFQNFSQLSQFLGQEAAVFEVTHLLIHYWVQLIAFLKQLGQVTSSVAYIKSLCGLNRADFNFCLRRLLLQLLVVLRCLSTVLLLDCLSLWYSASLILDKSILKLVLLRALIRSWLAACLLLWLVAIGALSLCILSFPFGCWLWSLSLHFKYFQLLLFNLIYWFD